MFVRWKRLNINLQYLWKECDVGKRKRKKEKEGKRKKGKIVCINGISVL